MNRQSISDSRASVPAAPGNHHRSDLMALKFYPFLLLLATSTAAVFCSLYLNKPTSIIVHAAPPNEQALSLSLPQTITQTTQPAEPASPALSAPLAPATPPTPTPAAETDPKLDSLLPTPDHLPGDQQQNLSSTSASSLPSPFVPTSLMLHQSLTIHPPLVTSPITTTLEFPAFFRAGTLRWNSSQRARCEELLTRLKAHRQECQRLRVEAAELLDSWNEILRDSSPPVLSESQPVQR